MRAARGYEGARQGGAERVGAREGAVGLGSGGDCFTGNLINAIQNRILRMSWRDAGGSLLLATVSGTSGQ